MGYYAGAFDVAVVGAGHAGCEAGLAAARLGLKTIIFAINLDSIANMPCNPSIGGTAKSQLVREIDALGGEMGRNTDKAVILSRMLNISKGPAVFSQRVQVDRRRYQIEMKKTLENQDNVYIRQAEVTEIVTEVHGGKKKVVGVVTNTGARFDVKAVILATGTYLRGKIIIGNVSFRGGPDGLFPSDILSSNLKDLGIRLMRFKTGTPARIDRKSISFSEMEEQPGDSVTLPFSHENEYGIGCGKCDGSKNDNGKSDGVRSKSDCGKPESNYNMNAGMEMPPQAQTGGKDSCWLTYTDSRTHEIIRSNLHRSPLYSGMIEGRGPRYCPSIEDKIVRFPDRDRHQVFVEPMGLETGEMYLQGMSSSMPEDVQIEMIHCVKGLENAFIMRSAYAIEYDCIDPRQLKLSLEFRDIAGLFAAGQINGSSGYEEAAAQGLMAGINAAMLINGKNPVILDRAEAYIGVLIDDLVTKGTNEPYRMMSSRAEYRLLLRQDNADLRLTPVGNRIGLISDDRYNRFIEKRERINRETERLKSTVIPPTEALSAFLKEHNSAETVTGIRLGDLLRRPEISYASLKAIDPDRPDLDSFEANEVEIIIKYEGYIKRELEKAEQMRKLENKTIPDNIDYESIRGLSAEAKQKLAGIRPESIGQAARISGVSPADISILLIYIDHLRKSSKPIKEGNKEDNNDNKDNKVNIEGQ